MTAPRDRSEQGEHVRCTAVVLLGGKGSRVGGDTPKQYLEAAGLPLFLHCVKTFLRSEIITDILLVIPAGDAERCGTILASHGIPLPDREDAALSAGAPEGAAAGKLRGFCEGGEERYESVLHALRAVAWPCDYVFIHDGARPLVRGEDIRALFDEVRVCGAAVAANPCRDTVKIADGEHFVTDSPDRSTLWNVQTPQVFSFDLARRAYEAMAADLDRVRAEHIPVTDDAFVAQRYGGARVRLVETGSGNIKVTTPEDLTVAEALLKAGEDGRG